jgi:hypothetical protein
MPRRLSDTCPNFEFSLPKKFMSTHLNYEVRISQPFVAASRFINYAWVRPGVASCSLSGTVDIWIHDPSGMHRSEVHQRLHARKDDPGFFHVAHRI